jgi:hypothetical protein
MHRKIARRRLIFHKRQHFLLHTSFFPKIFEDFRYRLFEKYAVFEKSEKLSRFFSVYAFLIMEPKILCPCSFYMIFVLFKRACQAAEHDRVSFFN